MENILSVEKWILSVAHLEKNDNKSFPFTQKTTLKLFKQYADYVNSQKTKSIVKEIEERIEGCKIAQNNTVDKICFWYNYLQNEIDYNESLLKKLQ